VGEIVLYIGAHISIRNGYLEAAKYAHSIGAKVYQYFPKNPRSLSIKQFDQQDALNCSSFCRENGIVSVAHTPYPTNLAADVEDRVQVVESVLNDLQIAEACGSIGVVVHFGVVKRASDPLEGYKRMIETLNQIIDIWDGSCLILVENNAGKSGPTGTTFEELVQVRLLTNNPQKIGFCYDTCHGFASGLWNGDNWRNLEMKGVELGFFDHLKIIHLNNSKYESGSMKDRHANIHNGYITTDRMKEFIKSSAVENIPMVLETPSSATYTHQDEILFVKNFLNS
jgi:deoxyribonuclease IV